MSEEQPIQQGYEVGYAKPPKHTQFKKGRSGNLSGRPKDNFPVRKPLKYELTPEKFKETFLEEAYRMVNINTGGGEESIPIARAVMRALGVKAAKGHVYAQKLFAQTLFELEAQNRRESERQMESIIEYKEKWTQELEHRASHGLPIDAPVPHPDDVVYNMHRGTVEVRGPLSQEDKEKQEYFKELLVEWQRTKAKNEAILARPIEHEAEIQQRKYVQAEVDRCHKIIPMLEVLSNPPEQKLGLFEAKKRAERLE